MTHRPLDFCEGQELAGPQGRPSEGQVNGWSPEVVLVDSQVPLWDGTGGLGSWEMCVEEDLTPKPLPLC